MFHIIKIIVFYFHLFPNSRPALAVNGNGGLSNNVKQDVELKMNDFRSLFSELFKHSTLNPTQVGVKGKIFGKLEEVIENAIVKENKLYLLHEKLGGKEKDIERGNLYRVLLGIVHRVDRLEYLLSSGSDIVIKGNPRVKRWTEILKLKTPLVTEFRKKILEAQIDEKLFINSVKEICKERNDRASHVDVSLPIETLEEDSLKKILAMMRMPVDRNFVRTLEILLAPLSLPPKTSPSNQNQGTVDSQPKV